MEVLTPIHEVLTPIHLEDLDVSHATFARPDLTTFAGLGQLGLEVVGQRVEPDRAVLACRVAAPVNAGRKLTPCCRSKIDPSHGCCWCYLVGWRRWPRVR